MYGAIACMLGSGTSDRHFKEQREKEEKDRLQAKINEWGKLNGLTNNNHSGYSPEAFRLSQKLIEHNKNDFLDFVPSGYGINVIYNSGFKDYKCIWNFSVICIESFKTLELFLEDIKYMMHSQMKAWKKIDKYRI